MRIKIKLTSLKRLAIKLLLWLCLISVSQIPFSIANLGDLEISTGNLFRAGSLDLTLSAEGDNFVPNPDEMLPGDTVSRNLYLGNSGTIELEYRGEYEYDSGNSSLCDAFTLNVLDGGINIYSGTLSGFAAFSSSMLLANLDSDTLLFEITLPVGVDTSLSEQTCNFNLNFVAWQSDLAEGEGFGDEESLAVSLTTGDYFPPAPPTGLHILDHDGVDLGCGGVTNNRRITVDWDDAPEADFDHFNYYIKDNLDPLRTLTVSESTGDIRDLDGVYRYCVETVDDAGNFEHVCEMDASFNPLQPAYWCSVTLDRSAPVTTLFSSNSPLREINEYVSNGDFEAGLSSWSTQGTVATTGADSFTSPHSGSLMAKIGQDTDPGNGVYENRLSQQIDNQAKNVSFYFNLFTYDAGFDDPNMVVKINDYEVWRISALEIQDPATDPDTTDWQQVSFDISNIEDPTLEIIFYSGNTGDDEFQSWLYIDDVSTAEAVVNNATVFTLTATDSLSSVAETYYSFNGTSFASGNTFNGTDLSEGDNTVWFYSVDAAGNQEAYNSRRVFKDIEAPDEIDDLDTTPVSEHSVMLDWYAPWENGGLSDKASIYDIRYSTSPITNNTLFNTATPVANTPAPVTPETMQSLEVSGLLSGTDYYFAIKAGDAVPNWSALTQFPMATTAAVSSEITSDVVINEIMWMGSSMSIYDEWIELRNMTDRDIVLTDWQIVRTKPDGLQECMFTFPGGASIPAQGYVVVSEYDAAHSALLNEPDFVVGAGDANDADPGADPGSEFNLYNTKLELKLYDGLWSSGASVIDTADDWVGVPAAGQSGGSFYSMERNASPEDGSLASNWHTCLADPADMAVYWDLGFVEKGTPGGQNLSQVAVQTPVLEIIEEELESSSSAEASSSAQLEADIIEDEEASPTAQAQVGPSPSLAPEEDNEENI